MAERSRHGRPFAAPANEHTSSQADDDVEERVRGRLRQLRDERGLTLAEVAFAAGMATSTLSRLETGARRLTLAHLPALARALGIATDELVAAPRRAVAPDRSPWTTADGVTFVPLTEPGDGPRVCRLLLPAGLHHPAPKTHEGHQRLHVIDGRLRLVLGGKEQILAPGDSTEFSTWLPHCSSAVEEPVELLVIFDPLHTRG
ncbi:helix-turn-helix domain-containing protein [Conexibacter woesei]|uniref:Transcriptional regulator, XRE family n=1 Tax=Conexibacter woesei (strain DSM 14684 / CCUG 47730 / CIP 108061 / JCM 11494 / NBRC 100937 / ID131577) TaxID=469383 RepID=D3F2I0_CONWI|nr:XRE family transcriptional regulator [Conexibacter woesei]ADB52246.1 transcriptional regulator, XRE family [Conexibacter woesei DSM 14684]